MTKYGFDYFTQRVEVLTEMARPSKTLTGPIGEKLKYYIEQINKVLRLGGTVTMDNGEEIEVPGMPTGVGSPIQNRGYKYIIAFMTGVTDIEVDPMNDPEIEVPDVSDKTKVHSPEALSFKWKKGDTVYENAKDILGIPPGTKTKDLPGPPLKIYTLAIAKWAKEHEEEVLSEEFGQRITNPDRILKFIADDNVRLASHSNQGINKTQRTEETFGMDVREYHKIVSELAPYLNKINRMHHAENMRKTKSVATDTTPIASNIATDNIFITIYVLEDIKVFVNTIAKVIQSNMDPDEFYNVLAYGFDKESDENENIQMQFYKISKQISDLNQTYFSKKYNFDENAIRGLMSLASNPRNSDYINDTIEYFKEFEQGLTVNEIKKELDSNKSFMDEDIHTLIDSISFKIADLSDESMDNTYDEFNQLILDKVLITPELKSKFHVWYIKVYLPERIKKAEDIIRNHQENMAGVAKIAGEHDKLSNTEDKLKQKQQQRVAELEAKYENPEYGGDIKSEYSESYVMNYMTEQVRKDKFKPIGEFKERGFKKPTNYWQGRNK